MDYSQKLLDEAGVEGVIAFQKEGTTAFRIGVQKGYEKAIEDGIGKPKDFIRLIKAWKENAGLREAAQAVVDKMDEIGSVITWNDHIDQLDDAIDILRKSLK